VKVKLLLLIIMSIFGSSLSAKNCINFDATKTTITKVHLKGELSKAVDLSNDVLQCSNISAEEQIEIHLMLATIYDRMGLHKNSRPHPQNLIEIKTALSLANKYGIKSLAQINFSYAEYHYRAEMPERLFIKAQTYALTALKGFKKSNDLYGESDANHILGLIHLQKNDFAQSRIYFDLSLEIENMSKAPRPRILADYQRHIGFIHLRIGEIENALPYFVRSFNIRRDSGIEDAALFAAHSLASTLVDLGRTTEAYRPINYALKMAKKLNSLYGTMISLSVLAKIYEQSGNFESAKETYKASLATAKNLNHRSGIKNSKSGIERVDKLILESQKKQLF